VSELADYQHLMLGHANQTRPAEDVTLVAEVSAGTPAGKRHLRGIPVVGIAGGTMDGTDPVQALLEKAEQFGW
jgi:glutamate/tyrosine decarboxylase-like PLP-dependent enzyme